MKKIIVVCLIMVCLVSLTSCGASWEQTKKNIASDFNGGIDRDIRVYDSRTGETLWSYRGKAYIADESGVGNFTVVYYTNGYSKKADFIGENISLMSIEL